MGGGAARAVPPKVHEVAFPVSLEDLYKGATKKLKITRRVEDPASPGQLKTESVRPKAPWCESSENCWPSNVHPPGGVDYAASGMHLRAFGRHRRLRSRGA